MRKLGAGFLFFLAAAGAASAEDGTPVSIRLEPSFFYALDYYDSHPEKRVSHSGTLSLSALIDERFWLSGTLRLRVFELRDDVSDVGGGAAGSSTVAPAVTGPGGQGNGNQGSAGQGGQGGRAAPRFGVGEDRFEQYEGYLAAGYVQERFGILVHAGVATDDGGDFDDDIVVGGASLRLSAWGDVFLEASASDYPDTTVLRASAAWRMPLGGGFAIEPGAAAQRGGGDSYGNAFVSLRYAEDWGEAWVGVKAGEELRPTYLFVPAVFKILDIIQYGAWAGARIKLRGAAFLALSYEYHALRSRLVTGSDRSALHSLGFGLGAAF